ncbi:MAG: ATP-binding protein [Pseudomonadota bacterium]
MLLLRDLSLRYKIPLRGTAVILITALAVTASLVYRESLDLKQDLKSSSESMARVLAHTITPAVIHDDVWRAFEIVRTPFQALSDKDFTRAERILVLDERGRVFVSTHPEQFPILSEPARSDAGLAPIAPALASLSGRDPVTVEEAGSGQIFVLAPLVADGVRIGTLVLAYSRSVFAERFAAIARDAVVVTLLVVAVLLPVSWFWAHRMAIPLVRLADGMKRVGQRIPEDGELPVYESRDEIGEAGAAFKRMVAELRKKEAMEKQVMVSERLAALGRLSAGIAHEINNPLGGMLNAISTYRRHGGETAAPQGREGLPCIACGLPEHANLSRRTLSLLERGLTQIKETVGALLVEAKVESHALAPEDVEDIHTLVLPDVQRKGARLVWANRLVRPLPLPSTLVRQILLNLLLNATNAIGEGGRIDCQVRLVGERVEMRVANDGAHIPESQLQYLFEPFFALNESGHGLGLWVTYQIVQQLGGRIAVHSRPGETCFTVELPLDQEHETRAPADAVPG